jgi:hypothetical protein
MLRPWRFAEPQIEKRYNAYFVQSLLDRTKPVFQVAWFFTFAIRVAGIIYRVATSYKWTIQEIALTVIRMMLMLLFFFAFRLRWTSSAKLWIGVTFILFFRFGYFVVLVEQAGMNQIDSVMMFYPIIYTFSAGLAIPSFEEVMVYIVTIFVVKPFTLLLRMHDDVCSKSLPSHSLDTEFQTVLVQNIFLICTALGAFYHVTSDQRRHWLLAYEVFGPLNAAGPARAMNLAPTDTEPEASKYRDNVPDAINITTSIGLENLKYDLMQDGWFSSEESAEQLDLWRAEKKEISARSVEIQDRRTLRWRRLGRPTGFSRVHPAVDEDSGDRLAVKMLTGGPAHAAFARREAARMMALSHPGLAEVRGGGRLGRSVWVALEYCDGGSVEARLMRRQRPLAAAEARRLGRQAAAAVAYLHRHGLLHGNLKASPNFLPPLPPTPTLFRTHQPPTPVLAHTEVA